MLAGSARFSPKRSRFSVKIMQLTSISRAVFFIICFSKRVVGQAKQLNCLNGGVFHPALHVCQCQFAWTGRDCSKWKHHLCYFDSGYQYRGSLRHTKSGETCATWTTGNNNNLYPLGKNGIGLHNFCRNPGNSTKGLWCYLDGAKFMDYCNATVCPDEFKIVRNVTADGGDSAENETVRILFGPLISGVCAGVVVLLLIIGTAEYFRRRNARRFLNEDSNVKNKSPTERNLPVISNQESRPGGVVTVNMDTGETRQLNNTHHLSAN